MANDVKSGIGFVIPAAGIVGFFTILSDILLNPEPSMTAIFPLKFDLTIIFSAIGWVFIILIFNS